MGTGESAAAISCRENYRPPGRGASVSKRLPAYVGRRSQSNMRGSFAAVSSSAGVYVETVISERRPE
jgi:hypothetical protein